MEVPAGGRLPLGPGGRQLTEQTAWEEALPTRPHVYPGRCGTSQLPSCHRCAQPGRRLAWHVRRFSIAACEMRRGASQVKELKATLCTASHACMVVTASRALGGRLGPCCWCIIVSSISNGTKSHHHGSVYKILLLYIYTIHVSASNTATWQRVGRYDTSIQEYETTIV